MVLDRSFKKKKNPCANYLPYCLLNKFCSRSDSVFHAAVPGGQKGAFCCWRENAECCAALNELESCIQTQGLAKVLASFLDVAVHDDIISLRWF